MTISDKKIPVLTGSGSSNISYYNADVVTANDYYPGGMMMVGRKYTQSNLSYRYGFNAQEHDKELNENITTALFWEYDSRVGRRWNVDPISKPNESSYLAFAGNPIWFTDILGNDTTQYYNNNGDLLMTVGNGKKGYNRAMIVKDDKVKAISEYSKKYANELNGKSGASNSTDIDAYFNKNGYGVVYDLDGVKKFLDENRNTKALFLNSADRYNGKKLISYGKLSVKGKTLAWIRSETSGGLILKNNIVTVGSPSFFVNKSQLAGSDYWNNSEPNSVGGIHDHPFASEKEVEVKWYDGFNRSSWVFYPGPSPNSDGSGDKSEGNKPKQGYRNVVIDDKYIYLYDESHPDVKIQYK